MSSFGGVEHSYPAPKQSTVPTSNKQAVGQQESSTFFNDPAQAAHLSKMMEGLVGGASNDYLEFIRNPTASPYFQNAYQGLLEALRPEQDRSRQALTDTFRAAGGGHGMTGGAHQVAAGQLESDYYGKQLSGLTDLLTKLFPQVTNALFAPISETDSLLSALKQQESKSVNYETQTSGPSSVGGPFNGFGEFGGAASGFGEFGGNNAQPDWTSQQQNLLF